MLWTEADPGLGDPEALLALAADLQGDAEDAAAAARMLRSVQHNADDAVWKGSSANAFRDRIDTLPGHLHKLTASYSDAAAGLRAYAASVRQIADDTRVQQQLANHATADLQAAQAEQAAWTAPPHPVTGQPDPAAPNPHDEHVMAANASVRKAKSRLHELAGQRQVADRRLVGSLGRARSEGMQNKHWWQRALDVAAAALAKITIVLMVVALVAIVLLAIVQPELIPGLLLLTGQLLAGLSAAQLAVDGTRKATGEDVSWGSLGLEAIGLLPGLGTVGKLADAAPALARSAEALRGAGLTVRGLGAAGTAFAHSLTTDLKATRYLVRVADTGLGATFMAGVEREGKTAGQMLNAARDAAGHARAAPLSSGDFVLVGNGTSTRVVNFRPHAADPKWGLTPRHLEKHMFGDDDYSLKVIDPGGNTDIWLGHLQSLATTSATKAREGGIIDIMGRFPHAHGPGTFRLGLRLAPKADGTFDLVTILTGQ